MVMDRKKKFSLPLCYYHNFEPYMESAITEHELRTHKYYGIRREKWKREWGVPDIYIVDRLIDDIISIPMCPFIGTIFPILNLIAHSKRDLIAYIDGAKYSQKEVLIEVARWEILFIVLECMVLESVGGYELYELENKLEHYDFRNKNNQDLIKKALKLAGEYGVIKCQN